MFQPESATLGEHDARHDAAFAFAGQFGHDAGHVGQGEFQIRRLRQHAAPGVEHHHRLSAGFDLRVQVVDHGARGHFQNVMHQVGAAVHHLLDLGVAVAALAFDHVAGQRERAAGEADQRHRAIQRLADFRHRVDHVAQMVMRIRRLQVADRPFLAQRPFKLGAFALGEIQAEAHRVGHREDVGEQNRRVQVVARQRLQRDFRRHRRRLAQIQEAAGAGARGAVLGQIAAGLAHQPGRRVFGRLPQQGAKKGIVFEGGHDGLEKRTGAFYRTGRPLRRARCSPGVQCLPVLPKPPSPRWLASKSSTTLKLACTTGTMTICAMRSNGWMVNAVWPRFHTETSNWPW